MCGNLAFVLESCHMKRPLRLGLGVTGIRNRVRLIGFRLWLARICLELLGVRVGVVLVTKGRIEVRGSVTEGRFGGVLRLGLGLLRVGACGGGIEVRVEITEVGVTEGGGEGF